ncbi:MAG: protein kinase, partial [Myxococcota bacterium]
MPGHGWKGFTLEAELGRGGMGVVHLAHHPQYGRVALKQPNAVHSAFALQSLRAEIRFLTQLSHPSVVNIVAHGAEEPTPWMAMELLPGHPLSAHLTHPKDVTCWTHSLDQFTGDGRTHTIHTEDSRTEDHERPSETYPPRSPQLWTPAPPPQQPHRPMVEASREVLLGWLYQVAQALSYIHGQGIVHADLKPSNILITPDGRAVLVDFGLATPFGSRVQVEAVQRAGLAAGTVGYISPEQCAGEPLDARSDMYALGCLMFEVLAGRPLTMPRDNAKLSQAMDGRAERPSLKHLGVQLPDAWQALATVTERLLTQNPRERLGYAHVVLRALEGAGVVPGSLRNPTYEGRPYLHKPPLIGRQHLMAELETQLDQVQTQHQGQLLFVEGESGVGKTRLVEELIRSARQHRFAVVLGTSSNTRGGDHTEAQPLGLFVPLLRSMADAYTPHPSADPLFTPTDVALLAPYAPSLKRLPGAERHTQVTLADLPVESALRRLFLHLVEVFQRAYGDRPTLFVFDDLQWADELSLGALSFLSKAVVGLPWLVVGTHRADESNPDLRNLIDESDGQVIALERLGVGSVAEMVGQMLTYDLPPALVETVASRSGGNPFFVAEFLQTMADTGRLRLGPEGQWLLDTTDHPLGELPEPESIQTLLANRLKRLSNTSRRLCQVAAVLGRRMESKVLCHTSGLKRFRFTCALDELIQLHIVQVDPTLGSETVVFVHDTLREVAYAQAGDAREAIHHQAAQTLEAQEQFDPAASALHWVLGGDPRRGKLRYIEAARRDTERWAMRNACRHLEAALNLGIPAD